MRKEICLGLGAALAFVVSGYAQNYKINKVGSAEESSFDVLLDQAVVTEAASGAWLTVDPKVPDGKVFRGFTVYDQYGTFPNQQRVSTTAKDSLHFTMPDHDVYVKASFETLRYSLVVNSTDNGRVLVTFNDRTRDRTKPGTKVTVTPSPAEGYTAKSITVTKKQDENVAVDCVKDTARSDGSCNFDMPNFDVLVNVNFVPVAELSSSSVIESSSAMAPVSSSAVAESSSAAAPASSSSVPASSSAVEPVTPVSSSAVAPSSSSAVPASSAVASSSSVAASSSSAVTSSSSAVPASSSAVASSSSVAPTSSGAVASSSSAVPASSSAVASSSSVAPASSSAVASSSSAKPASSSSVKASSSSTKASSSSAKPASSSSKPASSSSAKSSSSIADVVVEAVATEEDLPSCTVKRENMTYYVSSLKAVFVCKSRMWSRYNPGPNFIPTIVRTPKFAAAVNGRSLQISGAKVGANVSLFDLQGRVIYNGRADAASFSMDVPQAGAFLLRIGSQQKVVNVR